MQISDQDNIPIIQNISVFPTGEVFPKDIEGADGYQKQGRSILSCSAVSSPLLTLHPVCAVVFPLPLIFICHSSLVDFLLFSFQPLMNGWKVGVPFKKSTSSAPKGGAKADGQVRRFSRNPSGVVRKEWSEILLLHVLNEIRYFAGYKLIFKYIFLLIVQCLKVKVQKMIWFFFFLPPLFNFFFILSIYYVSFSIFFK